jgi:hypothetical protein
MKLTRIPYSLPMARARRKGLKTQTRREAKQTANGHLKEPGGHRRWHPADPEAILACPYGQPGDILLPIEPWRALAEFNGLPPIEIPGSCTSPIWLDANGPAPEGFGRYRHARFMPKHLIQARDELVDVRVERLQDISDADAIAEGIERGETFPGWYRGPLPGDGAGLEEVGRDFKIPTAFPRLAYRALWEHINGSGSWDANPLVWVLEFKVVEP